MSLSMKMLYSIMDSTQGPTPILLIDDNTLINDEKWLLEYIETALHSFNIIGGFFKGEIQNRLVISIDSDSIILVFGLNIPNFDNEDKSPRSQSYQSIITFILGRTSEIEKQLYKHVDQIKQELIRTSFAIQASSVFPGLDPFQILTDFVRNQFTNGDPLSSTMKLESSPIQKPVSLEGPLISINESELRKFSPREQDIIKRALPHLRTGKPVEQLVRQTGLTYTELEWISNTLAKRKIRTIANPSDEIVRNLHHKDQISVISFLSRVKDRLLWSRRKKVSHHVLQELNNILFSLLEQIEIDGSLMNGELVREFVAYESVLMGKRLLADYFTDTGFQNTHVTQDTLKKTIRSIWRRNFGYSPEISICINHTPPQVHMFILFKDVDNPLTQRLNPTSRGLVSSCMITEGVLKGVVEDLVMIDTRLNETPPTNVEVYEIRCQSQGYDHCDYEIRVNFEVPAP